MRNMLMGASALIPAGVIFMMADPAALESLKAQHNELVESLQAIVDKADEEDRELSDEEVTEIEDVNSKIENLSRQIKARELVAPKGQGRKAAPEPNNNGDRTVPASPKRHDPRAGFETFGQFAMAVRAHGVKQTDNPLVNTLTTYGTEGTGADGGFVVPPEFAAQIWTKVMAEENLLGRCEQLQTGGSSMRIPKDETTPWQSAGGVLSYWEGEAGDITQSKPAFEFDDLRLVKLTALVPLSDELLEDAPGIESWLRAKAPAKMASKINTAIVRGNGVGQPLGILNSDSLVSVAKETSQVADSVYFANINNMWSRMYGPWRRNAVWLINQDIEPQLDGMAFDPTAASKVPVYVPAGGASGSPYATLKGRPVVPVEACSTLGDLGDIILVDLKQYWALTKAQGIKTDTSIHLYFDQAVTAFRFIFRLNGMPAWSSAITPENGNLTRSWAVALDARD